jgi:hypothetical protein
MAEPERDALRPAATRAREKMDVSVEIHCELCGSANYSLPHGDDDEASVHCNDCGADQGSVGQLKAALAEQALVRSAESLRRDLDRLRPDPNP